MGKSLSDAAKKAWATRRKKNPKKWRKRKPPGPSPPTREEMEAKPGQIIYYSTWEKEMVKKYGPKWFLNPKFRDYFVKQEIFSAEATFMDIIHGVNWTSEYEGCWSPVLYVDATISSEIEVTRDRVLNFMRVRAIWNPLGNKLKKFVLFDEADRLGYGAQGVLRSLLERFPGTVTIYTTNRIEGVDPAIVSRAAGGVFEFRKPDKDSLVNHLKKIASIEGKSLSHKTMQEIAIASVSVREAVGRLQQEVMLESVK